MNEIERLRAILERIFENDLKTENITPESRLREDIGMNSIGMLYVAMAIEQEFGVEFNNDDLINIKTVQDVLERIGGRA